MTQGQRAVLCYAARGRQRVHAFPTDAVGRVAAVLAALAGTSAPIDAARIDAARMAARFHQGLKVERAIRGILISLARVGEISTTDGGHSFARRLTDTG